MNQAVAQNVVDSIRRLYRTDPALQKLFDLLAERERDATSTTLDRLSHLLGVSRGEAVRLARLLQEAGCGDFTVGRRGQPSRFVWGYSCISLGKTAAEETTVLEEATNPINESEEEAFDVVGVAPTLSVIDEAKSLIARAFSISPSNIEINIRA